jgi:beta-galactosidase
MHDRTPFFAAAAFCAAALLPAPAGAADPPRSRELFDFDWKFALNDQPGAEQPGFDDSTWRALDLPHDFSIEGPFVGSKEEKELAYNGFRPLLKGWYRKSFKTTPAMAGKRVVLEFEGIYQKAIVHVNGTRVASNLNGYLDFECDITTHLKPEGGLNVAAILADNTTGRTSRWYTGGGIYRHVWLRVTDRPYVTRYGTYVTTPKITDGVAWVNVQTEVKNDGADVVWATAISEIVDPSGKQVASANALAPVNPGELYTYRQQIDVPNPVLWHFNTPNLYTLRTRVVVDSKERDCYETPFGIREIRMTRDGFFLNGKREFLRGFNIHHDHGCLGASAFDRAIERRIQTLKEIGCNAVRLSHNPHAVKLLEYCDRLGLLVFDEAYDQRNDQFYGVDGAFKDSWARDLETFMRRDRNHPSVFVWSLGNEGKDIFKPDFGYAQSTAMVKVMRAVDPTRPTTQGQYPIRWGGARQSQAKDHPDWRNYPPHQAAFASDVFSANYMEDKWADDRTIYPQFPFISSESTTGDNGRGAWAKMDKETACGIFYWGGIAYVGESHWWPIKSWMSGFVDLCGFWRPSAYDVQSYFTDKPMAFIAVNRPESTRIWNDVKISQSHLLSHWNFKQGETMSVETYTTGEEAELLLNNKSLGTKKREGKPGEGPRLIWSVPFEPGTLTAVARTQGKEIARYELKTAVAPARVRLKPDQAVLKADGQDLSHITVEVVDANGVVVPEAAQLIRFSVAGAGTNAGVDNGDPASDELFQAEQRSVFQGRALLVVRSKRQAGEISVKATADGLEPATLTLTTK